MAKLNDMKANASATTPMTRSNQKDIGLAFNGQDPTRHQGSGNGRYAGNAHGTGFSNPDRIQERQMPVKRGYHSEKTAGPVTASGAGVTGKRAWMPSAGQNFNGNPDKIQMPQMPNRTGNKCC